MNPASCPSSTLEPLEYRIAPATIFVGNPNVDDTEYTDAPFISTADLSDALAAQLREAAGGSVAAGTYFLRLTKGDRVVLFAPAGDTDFIDVDSGDLVAFFVDHNIDGEIQAAELTGLSLGRGVSVEVKGAVFGDIVTNLTAAGTLDDGAGPGLDGGLVSISQTIAKLSVLDVAGGIFAGGTIKNVAAGSVGKIMVGDSANGQAYDFFRGPGGTSTIAGGEGVLTVSAPSVGEAGPSITNVIVKAIGDRIQAGNGGLGAKGGSISNVQVTSDSTGLRLIAGNGGTGNPAGSGNGGAGGSISKVYISGFAEETPNSLDGVQILAGAGGDASGSAKGGAGGSLSKVFVGFDLDRGSVQPSANLSQDSALLAAGNGGDGLIGGKGGSIVASKVRISTVDGVGDELTVRAGLGGDALIASGKAGGGGSISKGDFRNQAPSGGLGTLSIQAGKAGNSPADGTGASGGSVVGTIIFGEKLSVSAGDGSSGKTGGSGGSISKLTVFDSDPSVVTSDFVVSAGIGGNGTAGNGGKGGSVSQVKISTGDFVNFSINPLTGGNGGDSVGGKGGAGGSVSQISVQELVFPSIVEGNVSFRGGKGGDGSNGGGAGGSLKNILFDGSIVDVAVAGGLGGSATVNGPGGRGGGLSGVRLSANLPDNSPPIAIGVTGSASAGRGGDAKGLIASGGAGGEVKTFSINVYGNVAVSAGDGGNAESGASGRGGSISKGGAFSDSGSGTLKAGDAGINGAKAGAGGSIAAGSVVRAQQAITISAGNGTHGGSGGSITKTNFSSSADSLFPAPNGSITVRAGNGSAEGSIAGKGGSLNGVIGYVSSGATALTTFAAGQGGGSAGKSAPGGSVLNLQIVGGGAAGGIFTIAAGDAGDAPGGSKGANGGSVKSVAVVGLESGTIFRSVAAGDGGDASTIGGAGGSVQKVSITGTDIGNRNSQAFGYSLMGGVFAGIGGTGVTPGKNGSAIDIQANAIAAIVAGKGPAPSFVDKVEKITVGTSGSTDRLDAAEGDILYNDGGSPDFGTVNPTAYQTNNIIGFIQDSSRTDANKFLFTDSISNGQFDLGEIPIDGLIIARSIKLSSFNVTPEAYVVVTGTSAVLTDHNNRNVV